MSAAAVRLALGSAQFGMRYGLGEPAGPLPRGSVRAILERAWQGGVDLIDTASSYGSAQRVIGELRPRGARFGVISKVPRLGAEVDASHVREAVRGSMAELRLRRLDALLVHHPADLTGTAGRALFRSLVALREEGLVRRLGVSVYDAAELNAVLERFPMQVVQLPLNVFDQRFARDGTLRSLARRGIEVHARSAFLQGLLLSDPGSLPARLRKARRALARFQREARERGMSAAEAALGFVAHCAGVARIVIGVKSATHLRADLTAFARARAVAAWPDAGRHATDDASLIDPRTW